MRFTIGLRWRTVKGEVEKNPVFLLKTGFFIGIWNMIKDSNLKITAFISLGIHILIMAMVSGSFRDTKIHRSTALRNIKVTLLPMVTKEKSKAGIIPPVPLSVGSQDREASAFDLKGLSQEPLFSQPAVARNVSLEEAGPISKDQEEEKTPSELRSPAMDPASVSGTDSNVKDDGDMVSSNKSASAGGNFSISLPFFRSGESYGNAFSYKGPGNGNGSGVGSGDHGSSGKGSGKGDGISEENFSSRGGGNVAGPKYGVNSKPVYPQEAREKGYEGEVMLRVEVLSNGRVGQIEIKKSSGYELLDRSALTTVKQWKFIPAKKGEAPIPLWVNIPVKFQLQ